MAVPKKNKSLNKRKRRNYFLYKYKKFKLNNITFCSSSLTNDLKSTVYKI